MDDRSRTKAELIAELEVLRAEVETLRQSECDLRAAQRIAHVGSWRWDRLNHTTIWSEETYRIHGLDPASSPPRGEEIFRYIHPNDLSLYRELLDRARAGFPFEVDLRIVRPDGEIRYVEARGEPGIFNAAGELLYLFGTVLDVTERKRVEEKLRRSEFALREAQRVAHVGSWQWDSEIGQVVWSEEIYRIHGLEPSVSPPRGRDAPYVHPDDRSLHERITADSYAGRPYEVDLRIIRPDGEIRYVEARGAPGIFNERGELIGLFGTVLDVTDRKRTEAKLREADRRWRSLLERVQLMVVGLDSRGDVEYVNPFFGRVTGYRETDVLGKCWFENFIAPARRRDSKKHFQELLDGNSLYSHHEDRILTESGEERLIAWNDTVLKDTVGQSIGTISIGDDITERHELERLKNEFISMVSHELRTPLTSIQVALSLLDGRFVDPVSEDGRNMIRAAAFGVDRLVRLVNDILDLERLESGKLQLHEQPCSPVKLIETAIAQVKELAESAGIAFSISAIDCPVYADFDRLVQVLTNLLGNAIRFSPAGSTIDIVVERVIAPDALRFQVKDRGRGIPEDQLDRVFDRFAQVDTSDSREKSGTGLGLAICRGIIQQHRGQIWAESILGQGSTFYFTLPLAREMGR
ncbi:PAS domain S-box protein [Pannus brasiliensis CCIBt3594]|uniref:histidine kinase n=1 Tax=Pannus brasiliensis CCIBt3594 TaxID=1427578 RepID=A0AAW9QTD6_9CHRO